MSTQLISILSVILISGISLTVILIFNRLQIFNKYLTLLISFASGTLLADVFIHILPTIQGIENFPLVILLSLIMYFFLESVLHIRHCHDLTHHHNTSLRYGIVSSDIIHNLLDGIAIAASFNVSITLGIATVIAIVFHEIPKEIGSVALLLKSGLNIVNSIRLNLVTILFGLLGVLLVGLLPENIEPYLLAFTSGNFLYIALSDLLPEIHSENTSRKLAILSFSTFLLGVLLMYLVTFIE